MAEGGVAEPGTGIAPEGPSAPVTLADSLVR